MQERNAREGLGCKWLVDCADAQCIGMFLHCHHEGAGQVEWHAALLEQVHVDVKQLREEEISNTEMQVRV